jgi:hypothetical protein
MKGAKVMLRKGILTLFVICVSVCGFAQDDGKINLTYQFQTGGIVNYEMSGTSLANVKFDQFPPMDTQFIFEMEFYAKTDSMQEEEINRVLMAFDQIKITARREGDTFLPDPSQILGYELLLKIDEKGNVLETSGQDIYPRIPLMQGDLRGRNFSQIFVDFFDELPSHGVTIGDEWEMTKVDTLEDMGQTTVLKMVSQYEFKKIVEKQGYQCAQITGKFKADVEQKGEIPGGNSSFTGSGKGKIEILFAYQEGILVYKKLSSTVSGPLELTGSQNLSGESTETSNTTFKLIK